MFVCGRILYQILRCIKLCLVILKSKKTNVTIYGLRYRLLDKKYNIIESLHLEHVLHAHTVTIVNNSLEMLIGVQYACCRL